MTNFKQTLILLLVVVACGKHAPEPSFELTSGIVVDEGMSSEVRAALERDWTLFESFASFEQDEDLKKILGVEEITQTSLVDWLKKRVSYILPLDTDLMSSLKVTHTNVDYDYPTPTPIMREIPVIYRQAPPALVAIAKKNPSMYLMKNASLLIYRNSKLDHVVRTFTFRSGAQMDIVSPRDGLVQLGPEVNEMIREEEEVHKMVGFYPLAYSIVRLASLWHEGVHGDGHHIHLGFPHRPCPEVDSDGKEHRYKGKILCDTYENGSYAVTYGLIKIFKKACTQCLEPDLNVLDKIILSMKMRIAPQPETHQSQVEKLASLREELSNLDPEAPSEKKEKMEEELRLHEFQKEYFNPRPDPTPESAVTL